MRYYNNSNYCKKISKILLLFGYLQLILVLLTQEISLLLLYQQQVQQTYYYSFCDCFPLFNIMVHGFTVRSSSSNKYDVIRRKGVWKVIISKSSTITAPSLSLLPPKQVEYPVWKPKQDTNDHNNNYYKQQRQHTIHHPNKCSRSFILLSSLNNINNNSDNNNYNKQEEEEQQQQHAMSSSTISTTKEVILTQQQQQQQQENDHTNKNHFFSKQGYNIQLVSQDPLIYTIPNFLSAQECEEYIQYVTNCTNANNDNSNYNNNNNNRKMTKSNPPDVTLDISKLWPLPFLSILSGLPPYLRLVALEQQQTVHDRISMNEIIQSIIPNICITFIGMISLAYLIVLPIIKIISNQQSRTSIAMALNLISDIEFVQPFVYRVCNITNHTWDKWEAPVITKYNPGAIFAKHNDASYNYGKEWIDIGGQRIVTCICYLNNVTNGGETYFDQLNISIKPIQGTALFFYPANNVSLQADDRTTHESKPVLHDDEKWIVQMFGRINLVPSPLGLPRTFDTKGKKTKG